MSIKTLIIFVTVYKEESITAAARKLNLTQPAVSAAIKELESRYSVRLFERMGRGIQKTPASHHLYEFASHITSLYQEMDRDFKKQVSSSPLRIGFQHRHRLPSDARVHKGLYRRFPRPHALYKD